jgi:adenylylsulfate reductase, subunit B
MPTFVRTDRCDGCHGRVRVACVHICPHDLMRLDRDGSATGHAGQAYNQEPDQCWACYACVKVCPQQAIGVRPYADVAPLGGSVQPAPSEGGIRWTVRFRNGDSKVFEYPVRTTPAGSLDPSGGTSGGMSGADPDRLADNRLFLESGGYRAGDPDELIAK